MIKKFITLAIIMFLAFGVFCVAAFAATANPTASTVLVDGSEVAYDAYNIANNNYFKLRDLAFTLNGTAKQFEVGWDGANNAISLTSGQPYTVAGGEMTSKGGGAKEATPTNSRIYLDGREVNFTAYNIDGNNYFKLRDIGEAFDFGVDWDGDRNTIVIDTSIGYSLDGLTTTPTTLPALKPAPTPELTTSTMDSNPFVGTWYSSWDGSTGYTFDDDGTILIYWNQVWPTMDGRAQGYYTFNNGILTYTIRISTATDNAANYWGPWGNEETSVYDIVEFGSDNRGVWFEIRSSHYTSMGGKYYKNSSDNYIPEIADQPAASLGWPSDLMPGVPEYGSGGRILEVRTPSSGHSAGSNVEIIIGDTTLEAYNNYCDRVLQSGWVLGRSWTMEELKTGKDCALYNEEYDFTLELMIDRDGNVSIYKRW